MNRELFCFEFCCTFKTPHFCYLYNYFYYDYENNANSFVTLLRLSAVTTSGCVLFSILCYVCCALLCMRHRWLLYVFFTRALYTKLFFSWFSSLDDIFFLTFLRLYTQNKTFKEYSCGISETIKMPKMRSRLFFFLQSLYP